jgi:biopolymer transport protein TolQ
MDIPVLNMIIRSGWVARIILVLLASFSLLTWAIIFNRWAFLSRAARLNRRYRKQFMDLPAITDVERLGSGMEKSPLAQLGKLCHAEYRRILDDARSHKGVTDWSFYLQNQFHMASERLSAAATTLSSQLDSGLFLLAIISSVAPFLGLLGTVWGIMNSFYEIGNQGSASLPVVAPGIAEALITTIVGLAVAIPAVFFYNIFIHKSGRVEDEMDEFSDQLLLRLKREMFGMLYRERPRRAES